MFSCPIVIWGCGNDGHKLYRLLKNQKIKVEAFCDSNRNLVNSFYNGIPIISCEEAIEKDGINLALAFHQWMSVIDKIKAKKNTEIFADYLYYEDIEPGDRCIICGSEECTSSRAHFAPFLVERMFSGKNIKTKLIHCKMCNFWFSRYRPNDSEMRKLYAGYRGEEYVKQRKKYESEYYVEVYESDSYMEKRKQELDNFFREWLNCDLVHTLLDYGGDEGQYIPDQFYNAERYVYEISGNYRKYDRCIKKSGYLYIEVPNSNVFMAYSDVEIHEHINFFYETMHFIASKMGLRVKAIETDYSYRALFVNE